MFILWFLLIKIKKDLNMYDNISIILFGKRKIFHDIIFYLRLITPGTPILIIWCCLGHRDTHFRSVWSPDASSSPIFPRIISWSGSVRAKS